MGANSLIVGSTILAYGASTRSFAYNSSVYSGGVYTPWYTYGGYWESGSTYSNSGYTPPSSLSVGSGYSLATSKGGAQSSTTSMAMVYTITVASNGNGTVAGGGQVITGGSIGISATPSAHYAFVSWGDGNTTASRTLTAVTADATIAATFAQSEWILSAATESTTKGTITLSGWTTGSYFAAGVTKSATATPKTGYRFLGWYRTGQALPDYTTATASLLMYSANTTYTAKFASTIHTLTVTGGTGGTLSGNATGSYSEGASISITATPLWNYTFSQWTCTGVSSTVSATHGFLMPETDVAATASFTIRPSFSIAAIKENGTYGTISLSSVGGTVGETSSAIAATGYTNVEFTLTASVTDPVHNMFSGWYSGVMLVSSNLTYVFTKTDTANVSVVAKFSQRPAYTIEKRVSDGSTTWGAGNPAYDAGCAIAADRTNDFSSPDKWLAGNITFTAAPATGWRVEGWNVSDVAGVGTPTSINTGVNPMTFSLSYDSIVTGYFGLVPLTATTNVHAASTGKGTAEISFGLDTGDVLNVHYGDEVSFYASAESGYGFAGWFNAAGSLVSAANPYSPTLTADLTLTAKFSATVTLAASHTVAADDTGTVKINSGTAGASATLTVTLGDTCIVKAVATAGSIFNAWHLTSDTGFATPIEGYLVEQPITVTANTLLTARFVGVTDLEDRYLAILNYDNNESAYDPLLGILASSTGTQITQAEWEGFVGAPAPTGGEVVAGYKFYKFTGSVASTVSALANGSLGFMQWKSSYLIPIVPTPETGQPQFTVSSPVVIGTLPNVSIVTNRHYILTAVWGTPVAVPVTVKYADGSDSTSGGFTMTPVTEERATVQGGVTDKYLQGASVILSAYVENGFVFNGWYYDRAGTSLVSTDTTLTHTVVAPVELYAKFLQDTDAVYQWEGGTANKQMIWRSKRYVANKPFNPSAAKVYAALYPAELNLYMSSSPDAPSSYSPTASVSAVNQDGFRLPMARPEKYLEIEVKSAGEVATVVVSTSMGGLAQ